MLEMRRIFVKFRSFFRARVKEARDLMGFNFVGFNVFDVFICDNEEVKDDLIDDDVGF